MSDDILQVLLPDLDFAGATLVEEPAFHRVKLVFSWPTATFPGNLYICLKYEFIKLQPIVVCGKQYTFADWEVRYVRQDERHIATFTLVPT